MNMSAFNWSSIVGAVSSAVANSGVTTSQASNILGQIASTVVGNASSQVQTDLNQLMLLVNNPGALANSGPTIINKIETISGLPATVLPLLEALRTACTSASEDPLKVAQLVAAIEQAVTQQTSIF
jgi:hypothetical protein